MIRIRIELKPQDCWIGAFWQRRKRKQHLWVCLLPMLPIHFEWHVWPVQQRMAIIEYRAGLVSLQWLAQRLGLSLEDARAVLVEAGVPVDLGVDSEADLLRDVENAGGGGS